MSLYENPSLDPVCPHCGSHDVSWTRKETAYGTVSGFDPESKTIHVRERGGQADDWFQFQCDDCLKPIDEDKLFPGHPVIDDSAYVG